MTVIRSKRVSKTGGMGVICCVCYMVTAGFQMFCYDRSGFGVLAVGCKSLTLILNDCEGSFVMKTTSCLKNWSPTLKQPLD